MTKRLSMTLVLVLSACVDPSTQQPAATVGNGEVQNAAAPGGITFPLEVLGAEGYTVAASIAVPKGSTAKRLWLQINNLSYDDKASVKLNAGAWIKLRNDNTVIEAAGKAYGGIGGGYSTLRLSIPISGAVDGANTLSFRFNQSDGISIGYRVLDLNFLDANAKKLIAANSLKRTDPNTWTPIRNTTQDIAKGKNLWSNATLKASYKTGASGIRAHCSECHSQDGRDLHQFNYSSYSIIERSKFHGLNQLEGEQIASYIRNLRQTLGTPSERCRPWNPPYQPGPGLDASKDWTCGAGLEAVLENDQDSLKSIFPTGYSKAAIAATGRLNAREIPVA